MGEKTIDMAVSEINQLASSIADLSPDNRPKEPQKILVLLRSLPNSYDIDKKILLSTKDLAYEYAISQLRQAETNMRREGQLQAAKTAQAKPKKKKSGITCYNCQKAGHFSYECRRKDKDNGRDDREGRQDDNKKKKTLSRRKRDSSAEESNRTVKKVRKFPRERAAVAQEESDSSEPAWIASASPIRAKDWILSSGASRRMTPDRGAFVTYKRLASPVHIELADGNILQAIATGDVAIKTSNGRQPVKEVYHVPGLRANLLSVIQFTDRGLGIEFSATNATITRDGAILGSAIRRGRQYVFENGGEQALASNIHSEKYDLWHRRFGHIGPAKIRLKHY